MGSWKGGTLQWQLAFSCELLGEELEEVKLLHGYIDGTTVKSFYNLFVDYFNQACEIQEFTDCLSSM